MSVAGLTRATVLAITEESTAGTYVAPSSATDFIALRPGSEMAFETEKLENDELLNDIGSAKPATGKESVSGSHPSYLRHSGVEGQEPQAGKLFKSIMGSKQVAGTEYNTVASSTTTVVKVDAGEGANFVEGQALLIKNSSGYEIRNVNSISGDDLTLNFALNNAPGTGVNLGKAITYIPTALAPTLSLTKYHGGGFAKEIAVGNAVSELSLTADANGFGEVEFSLEGTGYYFNPIIITSSNKYLDLTDDTGTIAVSVAEKIYKTPIELADALAVVLDAASTETYTVTYSSVTGKFTIASGSSTLSLLWNTGTNAANSIGTTLGFSVAANDTGAVTYTSDNAQTYSVPYTPSYDSSDPVVIKGVDLFIGTVLDNVCVCAQSVALTVSKTLEDVDCACSENGVLEKIPTGRTVELQVTALLKKYEVASLDAVINNREISVMMNAGPKSGGNWIPGKCFNMYLQSATINMRKPTGDSFLQVEMTITGFVSSTTKDLFINFV